MNTVNLNHPDTILGPFKNFVHIASSAELAGGGVSDFATRVASIGKLLETTLALRAHYVSFPRVRLTDGSSVSEDQLELVLMHENARVKFKQSLIRLEDELEQLKARIYNPEDADSFGMESDTEAVYLGFLNLVELYETGRKVYGQCRSELQEAPEGYKSVVEAHFRRRLEEFLTE